MSAERSFIDPSKPVTPIMIPILFWLGIVVCVTIAVFDFAIFAEMDIPDHMVQMPFVLHQAKTTLILQGIAALTICPLLWYIFCEVLATFFHMSRNIEEIRKQGPDSGPGKYEPEDR